MVFANLDPDKTGYISTATIRKSLGEDISEEALEAMIRVADTDGM